nr:MAG TPA: hypothetical protein [Caudoviricetes sp.]
MHTTAINGLTLFPSAFSRAISSAISSGVSAEME